MPKPRKTFWWRLGDALNSIAHWINTSLQPWLRARERDLTLLSARCFQRHIESKGGVVSIDKRDFRA